MSRSHAHMLAAVIALAVMTSSAHAGLDRAIEKTLGRQARDSVESQYQVISEGAAARYVARIGAELVQVSPRHDIEYVFKIIDTEQINAFALPWGYVYVTTGMLDFVDSSDQLAGVMGHEIAHVAEKHSLDQFKQQFWTSLFFGVIDAPATVLTAGQVGSTLYLLRHSRKDEQAADQLGAGYAYSAGYDPAQLAAFLRKLDQEHGRKQSTIEVYLSTHPTGERRQERLAELPVMKNNDPKLAAHIAQSLLSRHLANQAVIAYRQAVKLEPDDAAAHAGLARAYADLGAGDIARQELRRAAALGARDAGEIGNLPPAAPKATAARLAPPSPADQEQVKQTGTSAAAWKLELQDPVRQVRERAEKLDSTVRGLARRLDMAGTVGQPSLETERVLGKAQLTLYMIAETSDRVGAVADGLESTGGSAAEVAGAVARGLGAPAAEADRAQWRTLATAVVDGVARARNQTAGVRQQSVQAAELADKAASGLGSALGGLPSAMGNLGGAARGFAFMGLTESEVDAALNNARSAMEASQKALAVLREWRTDALSWRLSAAYLDTPVGERAALGTMAAGMIGTQADALAPETAGGFGPALLRAMEADAQAQKPVAAGATAKPAPAAPDAKVKSAPGATPATNRGSDLMLRLVLADVTREGAARQAWQGLPASGLQ